MFTEALMIKLQQKVEMLEEENKELRKDVKRNKLHIIDLQ